MDHKCFTLCRFVNIALVIIRFQYLSAFVVHIFHSMWSNPISRYLTSAHMPTQATNVIGILLAPPCVDPTWEQQCIKVSCEGQKIWTLNPLSESPVWEPTYQDTFINPHITKPCKPHWFVTCFLPMVMRGLIQTASSSFHRVCPNTNLLICLKLD